jgi:hypothetical protein
MLDLKQILIGCVGINIAFLIGGLAMEDYQLVTLAVLSGASCLMGIRVKKQIEEEKE